MTPGAVAAFQLSFICSPSVIILALLGGPRRFTDLMTGLPGISTNLLAQRLKSLEQQGIVRRYTLPRPLSSTVYELTARGLALQQAVQELGAWGSSLRATVSKV